MKKRKGLFDFNRDGKESFRELMSGYYMFRQWQKRKNREESAASDFFEDYLPEEGDDSWRLFCEDGSPYGLDPEDFDSEEDYELALIAEKYSQPDPENEDTRESCEEFPENETAAADPDENTINISVSLAGLDALARIWEEDFPNKRRYRAACFLALDFSLLLSQEEKQKRKERCRFILEQGDQILAANYLIYEGSFLYSQAIRDHFSLPCTLPEEDEAREIEFAELLEKIARRDAEMSFQIWDWCLEQFLPYARYDDSCGKDLSTRVFYSQYDYPKEYEVKILHYMAEHPGFAERLLGADSEPAEITDVIEKALKEKLYALAEDMFRSELKKAESRWQDVTELAEKMLLRCKNYEELETMEFFRDHLLPLIRKVSDVMVQEEIPKWEQEIEEYIYKVEGTCSQYAYTRRYAWRRSVPDGKKYHLDPRHFLSEQTYLEALEDAKYGWRKWYEKRDTCGLNVRDFETAEEFRKALQARKKEMQPPENGKEQPPEKLPEDKTIYIYCGVLLPFSSRPYAYRTEDPSLKIGDRVLVPVGAEQKEMTGTVVSVGQYTRVSVPFPVEKTKKIIRRLEGENT